MTKNSAKKKKTTIAIGLLTFLVFAQALVIAKLYTEKDNKSYEVNLVKINTEKDSIDYLKMKNDLGTLDRTVNQIHRYLTSKNVPDDQIAILANDSLSNSVYLAKVSNRYSQYLVNLEQKLQQVPLGMPTDGYISSNFGKRKNPIPPKTVVKIDEKKPVPTAPQMQTIEEKDSLGNIVKRTIPVPPGTAIAQNPSAQKIKEVNGPPAEADQMQFHKGLDIGVSYGSDVRCTAAGTVIFAGQKGGYGNCVIISHGNGLDTLYGHLSQILVEANDVVKVGQVIARSGNTGRSTGPHLHYEVHKNNTPVNPKLFLNL